jgi:hypothetical protein
MTTIKPHKAQPGSANAQRITTVPRTWAVLMLIMHTVPYRRCRFLLRSRLLLSQQNLGKAISMLISLAVFRSSPWLLCCVCQGDGQKMSCPPSTNTNPSPA